MAQRRKASIWRRFELSNPIILGIASAVFVYGLDWLAKATGWSAGFESLGQMALVGIVIWALTVVLSLQKQMDALTADKLDLVRAVQLSARLEGMRQRVAQLDRYMRTVNLERGPVLTAYCEKLLQEAVDMSRNAAELKKVLVREHHFGTVQDVLKAFERGASREYLTVWRIPAGDAAYSEHWKNYMRHLIEINRRGKDNIRIHMLLVIDSVRELERPTISAVCGYMHQHCETFCYSVIETEAYERRVRDARLETNYSDFGIYAGVLMYRTIDEDEATGEFTEDEALIQRYVDFHRHTMAAYDELNAKRRIECMLAGRPRITEDEFINADDLEREQDA